MIHKQKNMKFFLYSDFRVAPKANISENQLTPPKFCITIVFNFSWGDRRTQEKLERMAITAKANEKIAVSMKSINQKKKKNHLIVAFSSPLLNH